MEQKEILIPSGASRSATTSPVGATSAPGGPAFADDDTPRMIATGVEDEESEHSLTDIDDGARSDDVASVAPRRLLLESPTVGGTPRSNATAHAELGVVLGDAGSVRVVAQDFDGAESVFSDAMTPRISAAGQSSAAASPASIMRREAPSVEDQPAPPRMMRPRGSKQKAEPLARVVAAKHAAREIRAGAQASAIVQSTARGVGRPNRSPLKARSRAAGTAAASDASRWSDPPTLGSEFGYDRESQRRFEKRRRRQETEGMLAEDWAGHRARWWPERLGNAWRTVRVYICGTTADFRAERKVLRNLVFKQLNEKCYSRHIHVVMVDMSDGLAQEDRSDVGLGTVEHRLVEVNDSIPFFIYLSGERYGWVPPHPYQASNRPSLSWLEEAPKHMSLQALELQHGLLQKPHAPVHAFVYQRDSDFIETIDDDGERTVFECEYAEGSVEHARYCALKQELKRHRFVKQRTYRVTYAGLTAEGPSVTKLRGFAETVLNDLWVSIRQEFPSHFAASQSEASMGAIRKLTDEDRRHLSFLDAHYRHFMGRSALLSRMSTFWAQSLGKKTQPFVLHADGGSGKTALMAAFAKKLAEEHPRANVVVHFVSATAMSEDIQEMLSRLCRSFEQTYDLDWEIDEDAGFAGIIEDFCRLLTLAGAAARARHSGIAIIIDAVDQLEDSYGAWTMNWIPPVIPAGVCLYISAANNTVALESLEARRPPPSLNLVPPLNRVEKDYVLRQTLALNNVTLTSTQTALIMSREDSGNPLYLLSVGQQLSHMTATNVLVSRESVDTFIRSHLPDTTVDLMDSVLSRVEDEIGMWYATTNLHEIAQRKAEARREQATSDQRRSSTAVAISDEAARAGQTREAAEGRDDITTATSVRNASGDSQVDDDVEDVGAVQFGKTVVGDLVALLVCARHGLHEKEVLQLLSGEDGTSLPFALWSRLMRALDMYLHSYAAGELSTLMFFHRHVREAVQRRFFKNEQLRVNTYLKLLKHARRIADPAGNATWLGPRSQAFDDVITFALGAKQPEQALLVRSFNFIQARARHGIEALHALLYDLVKVQEAVRSDAEVQRDLTAADFEVKHESKRLSEFMTFVRVNAVALVSRPDLLFGIVYNLADKFGPCAQMRKLVERRTERIVCELEGTAFDESPDPSFLGDDERDVVPSVFLRWVNKQQRTRVISDFGGFSHELSACALNPAELQLCVGAINGSISLVDYVTGETDKSFTSSGGHIARITAMHCSVDGEALASGSIDTNVIVWDLNLKRLRARIEQAHLSSVTAVKWLNTVHTRYGDRDKRLLATSGMDNSIKIWEERDWTAQDTAALKRRGRKGRTLPSTYVVLWKNDWLASAIVSLDFNRKSGCVVGGCADGTLRVYEGAHPRSGLIDVVSINAFPFSCISAVGLASTGKIMVVGAMDGAVAVYTVREHPDHELFRWENEPLVLDSAGDKPHTNSVSAASFCPGNAKFLTASLDRRVIVWDTRLRSKLLVLVGHASAIYGCLWMASSSKIVSVSYDKTMKVWSSLKSEMRVSGGVVRRPIGKWVKPLSQSKSVLLSPTPLLSPTAVFSAAMAGSPQAMPSPLPQIGSEKAVRRPVSEPGMHQGKVTCSATSYDCVFAATGGVDTQVKIWSMVTGDEEYVLLAHDDPVTSVHFAVDSSVFLSGDFSGRISLWDGDTFEHKITFPAHESPITAMASGHLLPKDGGADVAEDATVVFSGDALGHVKAINGRTGAYWKRQPTRMLSSRILAMHTVVLMDPLADVDESGTMMTTIWVLVASQDGRLIIFDGYSMQIVFKCLLFRSSSLPLQWARFSEDGGKIIASTRHSAVEMRDVPPLAEDATPSQAATGGAKYARVMPMSTHIMVPVSVVSSGSKTGPEAAVHDAGLPDASVTMSKYAVTAAALTFDSAFLFTSDNKRMVSVLPSDKPRSRPIAEFIVLGDITTFCCGAGASEWAQRPQAVVVDASGEQWDRFKDCRGDARGHIGGCLVGDQSGHVYILLLRDLRESAKCDIVRRQLEEEAKAASTAKKMAQQAKLRLLEKRIAALTRKRKRLRSREGGDAVVDTDDDDVWAEDDAVVVSAADFGNSRIARIVEPPEAVDIAAHGDGERALLLLVKLGITVDELTHESIPVEHREVLLGRVRLAKLPQLVDRGVRDIQSDVHLGVRVSWNPCGWMSDYGTGDVRDRVGERSTGTSGVTTPVMKSGIFSFGGSASALSVASPKTQVTRRLISVAPSMKTMIEERYNGNKEVIEIMSDTDGEATGDELSAGPGSSTSPMPSHGSSPSRQSIKSESSPTESSDREPTSSPSPTFPSRRGEANDPETDAHLTNRRGRRRPGKGPVLKVAGATAAGRGPGLRKGGSANQPTVPMRKMRAHDSIADGRHWGTSISAREAKLQRLKDLQTALAERQPGPSRVVEFTLPSHSGPMMAHKKESKSISAPKVARKTVIRDAPIHVTQKDKPPATNIVELDDALPNHTVMTTEKTRARRIDRLKLQKRVLRDRGAPTDPVKRDAYYISLNATETDDLEEQPYPDDTHNPQSSDVTVATSHERQERTFAFDEGAPAFRKLSRAREDESDSDEELLLHGPVPDSNRQYEKPWLQVPAGFDAAMQGRRAARRAPAARTSHPYKPPEPPKDRPTPWKEKPSKFLAALEERKLKKRNPIPNYPVRKLGDVEARSDREKPWLEAPPEMPEERVQQYKERDIGAGVVKPKQLTELGLRSAEFGEVPVARSPAPPPLPANVRSALRKLKGAILAIQVSQGLTQHDSLNRGTAAMIRNQLHAPQGTLSVNRLDARALVATPNIANARSARARSGLAPHKLFGAEPGYRGRAGIAGLHSRAQDTGIDPNIVISKSLIATRQQSRARRRSTASAVMADIDHGAIAADDHSGSASHELDDETHRAVALKLFRAREREEAAEADRRRAKTEGTLHANVFRGVKWDDGKYAAVIMVNGRAKFLGAFDTDVEAAMAYDAAARVYHRINPKLNFPEPVETTIRKKPDFVSTETWKYTYVSPYKLQRFTNAAVARIQALVRGFLVRNRVARAANPWMHPIAEAPAAHIPLDVLLPSGKAYESITVDDSYLRRDPGYGGHNEPEEFDVASYGKPARKPAREHGLGATDVPWGSGSGGGGRGLARQGAGEASEPPAGFTVTKETDSMNKPAPAVDLSRQKVASGKKKQLGSLTTISTVDAGNTERRRKRAASQLQREKQARKRAADAATRAIAATMATPMPDDVRTVDIGDSPGSSDEIEQPTSRNVASSSARERAALASKAAKKAAEVHEKAMASMAEAQAAAAMAASRQPYHMAQQQRPSQVERAKAAAEALGSPNPSERVLVVSAASKTAFSDSPPSWSPSSYAGSYVSGRSPVPTPLRRSTTVGDLFSRDAIEAAAKSRKPAPRPLDKASLKQERGENWKTRPSSRVATMEADATIGADLRAARPSGAAGALPNDRRPAKRETLLTPGEAKDPPPEAASLAPAPADMTGSDTDGASQRTVESNEAEARPELPRPASSETNAADRVITAIAPEADVAAATEEAGVAAPEPAVAAACEEDPPRAPRSAGVVSHSVTPPASSQERSRSRSSASRSITNIDSMDERDRTVASSVLVPTALRGSLPKRLRHARRATPRPARPDASKFTPELGANRDPSLKVEHVGKSTLSAGDVEYMPMGVDRAEQVEDRKSTKHLVRALAKQCVDSAVGDAVECFAWLRVESEYERRVAAAIATTKAVAWEMRRSFTVVAAQSLVGDVMSVAMKDVVRYGVADRVAESALLLGFRRVMQKHEREAEARRQEQLAAARAIEEREREKREIQNMMRAEEQSREYAMALANEEVFELLALAHMKQEEARTRAADAYAEALRARLDAERAAMLDEDFNVNLGRLEEEADAWRKDNLQVSTDAPEGNELTLDSDALSTMSHAERMKVLLSPGMSSGPTPGPAWRDRAHPLQRWSEDQFLATEEIVDTYRRAPRMALAAFGGAAGLHNLLQPVLADLFQHGVVSAVAANGGMIIDGGTDSGVMRLVGRAVSFDWQPSPIRVVGVAPRGQVLLPDDAVEDEVADVADLYDLQENHTDFILPPTSQWGAETSTMMAMLQQLQERIPVIAVLANGGAISKHEVLYAVRLGIPVVVVDGSGRLADQLARAVARKHALSSWRPEVIEDKIEREIVRDGKVYPFRLTEDPPRLRALLESLIEEQRRNLAEAAERRRPERRRSDTGAVVKSAAVSRTTSRAATPTALNALSSSLAATPAVSPRQVQSTTLSRPGSAPGTVSQVASRAASKPTSQDVTPSDTPRLPFNLADAPAGRLEAAVAAGFEERKEGGGADSAAERASE